MISWNDEKEDLARGSSPPVHPATRRLARNLDRVVGAGLRHINRGLEALIRLIRRLKGRGGNRGK